MRSRQPQRAVAREWGVPLSTVQFWVKRAKGQPLDRVDWSDRPAGVRRPANRTSVKDEDRVLALRRELRDRSALGEFGAKAIQRAWTERRTGRSAAPPSLRTMGRILARRGALDGRHRQRRPPPPRGWFLPDVAARRAELDSFDIIEDLKIQRGSFVNVLTAISLHGGLCEAWPRTQITAKNTVDSLLSHWRTHGLPRYVKFDNDTIFQGTHAHPDAFGRVIRVCLSLEVTPVFAPPREPGFQAEIESFNGRWQAKVWQRFHFGRVSDVVAQSRKFIAANHQRSASRIEAAPRRRTFPVTWRQNLQRALRGTVIFIRRTNEHGKVSILGRDYATKPTWVRRLVRAELNLTEGQLRIYALRRRDPHQQPLLKTHRYQTPNKRFHE